MKKREAMRNLRKSLHKIRLKSTLWAKDKWKTIMIFNLLTDPLEVNRKSTRERINFQCIRKLLTLDRPLARLWVFAENLEDTT